ncbi:MAG TPA: hypothetical protein VFP61_07525 [Acidimicrobiales bacterium]|nr:hypothetical protein [Acidimicrobiales bacterium]
MTSSPDPHSASSAGGGDVARLFEAAEALSERVGLVLGRPQRQRRVLPDTTARGLQVARLRLEMALAAYYRSGAGR